MDNRETLTPSSGDAILKRHLFSEVARNWIKGRGHIERAYFVRRPDRVSDSDWPLRAAQFLKPPALPGDTYQSETIALRNTLFSILGETRTFWKLRFQFSYLGFLFRRSAFGAKRRLNENRTQTGTFLRLS